MFVLKSPSFDLIDENVGRAIAHNEESIAKNKLKRKKTALWQKKKKTPSKQWIIVIMVKIVPF